MRKHLLISGGHYRRAMQGATLLEVLVTIVILAFGLLGLAGMQAKIHLLELESFARGQAVVLLNDMVDRVVANRVDASTYVFAGSTGAGTTCATPVEPTLPKGECNCNGLAAGSAREICEWSNLLKGAAELKAKNPLGAMDSARGCITSFTVPNTAAQPDIFGMCRSGIQIDVVWQGTGPTAAPGVTCGSGSYGSNDAYRRAVSTRVVTGVTPC